MSLGYYRGQAGNTPNYVPRGKANPKDAPRSTSPDNTATMLPEEIKIHEAAAAAPILVSTKPVGSDTAKLSGYTGDMCVDPDCGSFKVRKNGTCTICEDCGNTTGCS